MKRAFTIVELLIAVAIASVVAFASITFLSRGASNVARGSFRVMAANESAWIISMLRSDISRSVCVRLQLAEGEEWAGDSGFEAVITDPKTQARQTCKYTFETTPKRAVFIRECAGKQRKISSDLLKSICLKKEKDCITLDMRFEDSNKSNKVPLCWSARIYFPKANPLAAYWKPLKETE